MHAKSSTGKLLKCLIGSTNHCLVGIHLHNNVSTTFVSYVPVYETLFKVQPLSSTTELYRPRQPSVNQITHITGSHANYIHVLTSALASLLLSFAQS